eukprot:11204987-Lingulodinium_polyedra.AAC.1
MGKLAGNPATERFPNMLKHFSLSSCCCELCLRSAQSQRTPTRWLSTHPASASPVVPLHRLNATHGRQLMPQT